MTRYARMLLKFCVWSLLLVGLAASAQVFAAEPLVLRPDHTVIVTGPGGSAARLQYYLLRYYVSPEAAQAFAPDAEVDRATSEHFPVLHDDGNRDLPEDKNFIAVGRTRFLSQADAQRLAEHPDSMLIARRDRAVVVVGPAEEAVSEFLNLVGGIRFYAPDELWTSRPSRREMQVGQLELFRPRAFATSWLAPYWERNSEWVRMNPTAGRLTISSNHALAHVFPPSKYAESHPEIYELRGGERRVPTSVGTHIWNPCLSAECLPELAMEHVRATMEARPASKYISMGMMDINFHCECEACQRSVSAHQSYSNLYYTFLNEVARRTREEFPGLLVTSLLYANARTPPVGIEIEPNIVVKVVTKTYRFVDPAALEAEKQRIKAFSDLGARWMIHDWCFSGVSPRSYMRQYASFLQWAKQNHIVGAYVEYSPGESWYLDGAKYWILTRLLADPYQDVDLLWKQYCDDMFGPASETMFRFFATFRDQYVYAPQKIELQDLPRQEPVLHSPQDVAHQRALLEKATALTKDDPLVQRRLAKIMRYFRAHELFALATYKPHRLHWTFSGEGINRDLLAFYVNDDSSLLDEAIRYYHEQRTEAPDDNYMDIRLGMPVSYVNNYTRGFASLLRALQGQAIGEQDLTNLSNEEFHAIARRCRTILRENVPQEALPERVELFEQILGKMLAIPTVDELPKIDGDLSDEVWNQAAPLHDFTERDTLRRPIHKTTGRVMRVGDKLVIGLQCRQVGEIWAQSPKETLTGTHIWRESGIEIAFGPLPQGAATPPFAQYVINAFGAFRGFAKAADNREGVQVEVKLDRPNNRYTVEAVLPLKAAGYDYTDLNALTFNVGRLVYTRDSYQSDVILGWHPLFITISDPASRGLVFFEKSQSR